MYRKMLGMQQTVCKNSARYTVASILNVHDSISTTDSMSEYWKQLRRESLGRRHEESKSLRSTSVITRPSELNVKQDICSELAERLRNFHEGADALADRLHTIVAKIIACSFSARELISDYSYSWGGGTKLIS